MRKFIGNDVVKYALFANALAYKLILLLITISVQRNGPAFILNHMLTRLSPRIAANNLGRDAIVFNI